MRHENADKLCLHVSYHCIRDRVFFRRDHPETRRLLRRSPLGIILNAQNASRVAACRAIVRLEFKSISEHDRERTNWRPDFALHHSSVVRARYHNRTATTFRSSSTTLNSPRAKTEPYGFRILTRSSDQSLCPPSTILKFEFVIESASAFACRCGMITSFAAAKISTRPL